MSVPAARGDGLPALLRGKVGTAFGGMKVGKRGEMKREAKRVKRNG
jgi:hypothetical protein